MALDLWLTKYGDTCALLRSVDFEDGHGDAVMQDLCTLAFYFAQRNFETNNFKFETAAHVLYATYDLERDRVNVQVRLKEKGE